MQLTLNEFSIPLVALLAIIRYIPLAFSLPNTSATEVQCGILIGEKQNNTGNHHGTRHRRMVSLDDLPQSCEDSNLITIDIPHDGIKRFFTKDGLSTKRRKSSISGSSSSFAFWYGEDSEDGSSFNFVQDEEGNIAGSMVDLTKHNVLQFHNQNGSYVVTITASSDFAPEGHVLIPTSSIFDRTLIRGQPQGSTYETIASTSSMAIPPPIQKIENNTPSSRKLYDDSGGNLDVMVVWTKLAECRASGLSSGCTTTAQTAAAMNALINLAVQETNAAYQASGVNTELLLVHSYQHPTYVETSFSSSLSGIRNGDMSGVHSNRETYGADIVALIIDNPSACGLAYVGPSRSYMYSVTKWSCATGYYSFGHEIGHNIGLNHDRGTKDTCGGSGYNYGYRDPDANFRTVLAYSCTSGQCDNNRGGGCTRIARYSTPNILYNGRALGTASEDNVRFINDVRAQVAGYYTHVTSSTPSPIVSPTAPTPTAPAPSPPSTEIQYKGNPCTAYFNSGQCTLCTGDCDSDSDCAGDLRCAKRGGNENVPGCSWGANSISALQGYDFCFLPISQPDFINYVGECGPSYKCGLCEGDCDSDSDCDGNLVCFQRSGYDVVAGCSGEGGERDVYGKDVCVKVSTPSPVVVPTISPVTAPTPTTPSTNCNDSPLRLKFKKDGIMIARYCSWVANKDTQNRCALDGISSICPSTCGTCDICIDGTTRFKLQWNGNTIARSCIWVANKQTTGRCAVSGMSDTCRVTCNSC